MRLNRRQHAFVRNTTGTNYAGPPDETCEVCGTDPRNSIHDPLSVNAELRMRYADVDAVKTPITEGHELRYRAFVKQIADADAAEVLKKDEEYGSSWKRRGGVGAYFTMIRKVDRLNQQVPGKKGYDIFAHLIDASRQDGNSESLLDTIRDLRRYLILIEAEHLAGREAAESGSKSDSDESKRLMTCVVVCDDCKRAVAINYEWLNRAYRYASHLSADHRVFCTNSEIMISDENAKRLIGSKKG